METVDTIVVVVYGLILIFLNELVAFDRRQVRKLEAKVDELDKHTVKTVLPTK